MRVEVGTTVDEAERQLILKTLMSTHNNKTKAAEILGISSKTLQNKLKEYSNNSAAGGVSDAPEDEAGAVGYRADVCDRAVLSQSFVGELLRQRIEQTAATNDVLAHEVLLMTRQAVETGLRANPRLRSKR